MDLVGEKDPPVRVEAKLVLCVRQYETALRRQGLAALKEGEGVRGHLLPLSGAEESLAQDL